MAPSGVEEKRLLGESKEIIRRNVEIARKFRDIRGGRIALVRFPIAYNSQTDVQVFRYGSLRETSLFSEFHKSISKYFHGLILIYCICLSKE